MKRSLLWLCTILLCVLTLFCSACSLSFFEDDPVLDPSEKEQQQEQQEQQTISSEVEAKIRVVYAAYVQQAETNGDFPLEYQVWLESIRGEAGIDGLTPKVGTNGNWWLGNMDTGVKARGEDGKDGENGKDGNGILSTEIIDGDLWITYTDDPNTPVNVGHIGDGSGWSADDTGLEYYLMSDGNYAVGVGKMRYFETVVIPDMYNGKPVTTIAGQGFSLCNRLTSVTLPAGLKLVDDYAFAGCTALKNIEIPDSVEFIGTNAFYFCTALERITIPSSVKEIGDYSFYNCTNLTELTFGYTLETIGEYAFYNCDRISTIDYKGSEDDLQAMSIRMTYSPFNMQGEPSICYACDGVNHTWKTTVKKFVCATRTTKSCENCSASQSTFRDIAGTAHTAGADWQFDEENHYRLCWFIPIRIW